MKRLIVILVLALVTACTPSEEGSEDPVLEDGQVQPGEQ